MLKKLVVCVLVAGCVYGAPRNDNIGYEYLGADYKLDPLGENYGYDSDPLIRFDAFDCTTFVETVISGGNVEKLNRIRYKDADIAFENRNHFIETDWLENNSDLVENISKEYGIVSMRNVVIDKRAWAKKVHGIDINIEPQVADVEYISYNNLGAINNSVPLIVLFIVGNSEKHDTIATDIAVVHMGFLMPGGCVLRHASNGRGVVDDDFAEYVKNRRNMKNNIGIALVKIK